ncbi:hypothetical protein B0O99DRAFT_680489 [Bisporella sp. PMI_857]|nr:hypothetical protein B0O99DRAFT_680489 [Bisporella sp. PMI_857]
MARFTGYFSSPIKAFTTFAIFSSSINGITAQTCFGHDGNQATTSFVCQPDAEVSSCCMPGDICYSNGLCKPTIKEKVDTALTAFFNFGCTDPTFNSTSCMSQNCLKIPGVGVDVCSTRGPGWYCCYGFGGCDCKDDSQVFSLAAATIITTINVDITKSTSSTSSISSTSSSSTSTISATTKITSTSWPSNTGSLNSATPSDSAADFKSKENKGSNKTGIAVGLGVGIPAAALIALGAFFLLRWRKTRNQKPQELGSSPPSAYSSYGLAQHSPNPSTYHPHGYHYPPQSQPLMQRQYSQTGNPPMGYAQIGMYRPGGQLPMEMEFYAKHIRPAPHEIDSRERRIAELPTPHVR